MHSQHPDAGADADADRKGLPSKALEGWAQGRVQSAGLPAFMLRALSLMEAVLTFVVLTGETVGGICVACRGRSRDGGFRRTRSNASALEGYGHDRRYDKQTDSRAQGPHVSVGPFIDSALTLLKPS